MSKTIKSAPKPTKGQNNLESELDLGKVSALRQEFFVAVMNMSWQLAIVVLVPIIGGAKLDKHFHTMPLWTIVGFIIAMIGMGAVIWRQMIKFGPKSTRSNVKSQGHQS